MTITDISTHSPRVGRTHALAGISDTSSISTHSPRVGRTAHFRYPHYRRNNFNSLAPRGANLPSLRISLTRLAFQLTRPAWGEPIDTVLIYIQKNISTHSPRVGRTLTIRSQPVLSYQFQLTRPARGEPAFNRKGYARAVISTHSPRVGRTLPSQSLRLSSYNFNSLAPRGANPLQYGFIANIHPFQLTRPAWGEPGSICKAYAHSNISTHSPRVGRTDGSQESPSYMLNFNSLAPRGANLNASTNILGSCTFQLTRPAWGEPLNAGVLLTAYTISTHSPRVGRTLCQ